MICTKSREDQLGFAWAQWDLDHIIREKQRDPPLAVTLPICWASPGFECS